MSDPYWGVFFFLFWPGDYLLVSIKYFLGLMHAFNQEALTGMYMLFGAKLIYSLKFNELLAECIQEPMQI